MEPRNDTQKKLIWNTGSLLPIFCMQLKTHSPKCKIRIAPPIQEYQTAKVLGSWVWLQVFLKGFLKGFLKNHLAFRTGPSAPTKCLVGYWNEHMQAQALRKFEKSHIVSFFFFNILKGFVPLALGGCSHILDTYCLASSMDICSKEHPFVSGINMITKASDARLIIV